MLKKTIIYAILISISTLGFAQFRGQSSSLEKVINTYLDSYPLSTDNRFKVAAYAELKGYYSSRVKAFIIEFGDLGSLTFYPRNCLLKLGRQFFYLNLNDKDERKIQAFNKSLLNLFESISLLGNHAASEEHIQFVNHWLSRKGIEPFDKIFTRHILIKYGKYDAHKHKVEFQSKWLPQKTYKYRGKNDNNLVVKPISPLRIVLDSVNLRGWYLRVGGYVYVEDVRRKVTYATGEQYTHNLSAFKLFAQKLFVQSAQHVVKQEAVKPRPMVAKLQAARRGKAHRTTRQKSNSRSTSRSILDSEKGKSSGFSKHKPLYHDKNWIPMMLGILRDRNIKVTDPAVLQHLINKPYFAEVYNYLTPEERKRVDKYNWRK